MAGLYTAALFLRILICVSLSVYTFSTAFITTRCKRKHAPKVFLALSTPSIAPELSPEQIRDATTIVDNVFGKEDSGTWENRREAARATTLDRMIHKDRNTSKDDNVVNDDDDDALQILKDIPDHELVYGELGIEALATILDAVGVRQGDIFLDIGSGDGVLVMGAALLYPGYMTASKGIEIVPDLYQRSLNFQHKFDTVIKGNDEIPHQEQLPDIAFHLGNIYEWNQQSTNERDVDRSEAISKATLAVCFATTWSRNIPGRKLDRLSRALGKEGGSTSMPPGARVVIIDGVLEPSRDGYIYEGEFKLHCPDTAPYSTARLYTRM